MIELKCLNAVELGAFVQSPEYAHMPEIPISAHRATSHMRNPRANTEDILLILAYEGTRMVGYLGMLPDLLHFGDAEPVPCAWLSCIWVDLAFRGQGISKSMVQKALELYGNRILITEFTGPAKRLYDKIGAFSALPGRQGLRLYRRLDLANILAKKGGKLAQFKPLWRVTDALGNAILDLRFRFAKAKLPEVRIDYVQQVDAEIGAFIAAHQAQELFRRGPAELNWMTAHPWIIPGDPNGPDAKKYAFSAFDSHFEFIQLSVRDTQGKLLAFMLLAQRNQNLKINYCYCAPMHLPLAAKVLQQELHQRKIRTLIVYHAGLVAEFRKGGHGALHQKAALRQYELGTALAVRLNGLNFEIQDGDGDCGFT